VSRKLPDGFVLDVRFRKPAGVVAWLGHRYLVDRNGHYLGPQDDLFRMPPEHGGPDAPVIYDEQIKVHARGVMERNPFDPRWPAPRLAVGARLHLFLLEHGVYDEINVSRIDVTWVDRNAGNTYVGGRPQAEVTLYTEEGLEIRWGKTSAYDSIEAISEPPARDTDERKLQRLYTIMERHAQFPYLDAPVDLRLERAEPAGTR
jgi:hypothetical protein